MRAVLLAILGVWLAASAASAAGPILAFKHGNDFAEHCQNREENCLSYVMGVADAFEMVAKHLTNICRPKAVTVEQLFDVFIDWLDEHPAERHRPAATLAGLAYAEAWPCNG